jgi:hypothetical protein
MTPFLLGSSVRGFRNLLLKSVLGIRSGTGIRMFLGLLDPDPLVRGTDPDPDLSLFL